MQGGKTTLEDFLQEWNNGSDRLLVHTSGSTGTPKALWVEKQRMEASALLTCDFLGLQAGDTALLCLPLDFIAGKMMVVRALVRGLRLVCVEPSGHPLGQGTAVKSTIFENKEEIAFAAMVPLQVWNSLQVEEERERLRRIRHLIIGGGAIDDTLADALKDFPNAVWSTYGMTETLSHIALRRLSGTAASQWYTPMKGVQVSLNEEGCLVIDAPHVSEGRLETNDLAVLRNSEFRIVGRRDNVVCSGGLKIQIEEVERLLRPCLSANFLLTKIPDTRLGEALVMLYEGVLPDDLPDVCRRVLPTHWSPRHYISVEHLPLTANGKPARSEAARMAASAVRQPSR